MIFKIQNINNDSAYPNGFTLIEVLVSMSIFTMVVGMAVGTLIVLMDANAKAQNVQQAISNVSFALDSMTRDIRTGLFYECQTSTGSLHVSDHTNDCTSGTSGDNFAFTETGGSLTAGCAGDRIGYRFNSSENTIERRLCLADAGTSWDPITSPNVIIEHMHFSVAHTDKFPDTFSPLVTIYVEARAGDVEGTDTSFTLQASVTQQSLDL